VRFNLEPVLKRQKPPLTVYGLAQKTGLNYPGLLRLSRNERRGIEFETLDKLCAALNCRPGDLLVREA
jgi:putative transcriptional regulator